MLLTILGCGTSTGVPIPGCKCAVCQSGDPKNTRTRTSALITINENTNILIDATPDLRHQALRWNIERLSAVLYTHSHADHILGTDDLRVFNFVTGKSIPCYATKHTRQAIEQSFPYIFNQNEDYEGGMIAKLDFCDIKNHQSFIIDDLVILPFLLFHGKMEVTGFKIRDLAYATDCNLIPEESKKHMKGIKHLVLDGLREKPHHTHFTIEEAVKTAQELEAEHTYLTHMTHTVDYDTTSKQLPDNIVLAYDGMKIEFG